MISGELTIVDPWLPVDQLQREVAVVGWGLAPDETLVLMADVPLGWNDCTPTQLMFVYPRYVGGTFANRTKITVMGQLWGGRHAIGPGFSAQLELEDVVPSGFIDVERPR